MYGSFSEDALLKYQEILGYLENPNLDSSDDTYDFTRCIRPDGSAYGTRGVCQAPNVIATAAQPQAPKAPQTPGTSGNPLSSANRSAYAGGGGNAAVMKGRSIDQVIEQGKKNIARMDQGAGRAPATAAKPAQPAKVAPKQGPTSGLSTADRSAYTGGGGNAAVMKGKSIAQVVEQGKKNLARMDQGAGRSNPAAATQAPAKPSKPAAAPKQGATSGLSAADRSAYANGGGNAAAMKGKSIEEIIAQGKKNLARMDQGAGRSNPAASTQAAAKPASAKPAAPASQAGRRLTAAERSAYVSGGGNAQATKTGQSVDQVIAQGKKNLGRMDQGAGRANPAPTPRSGASGSGSASAPRSGGKAAPRPGATAGSRLTAAERSAYVSGGGNAQATKTGQSVDQVIAQGKKNLGRMDQGRGKK